jgi:hypothetical protein
MIEIIDKEICRILLDFHSINFEDKTSLIHSSTHSVILMCFCMQASRPETANSNWNYLNNLSNSLCLQQRYLFFFDLNRLTSSFENELKLLKLDDKEIALMLCLLIVSIGESNSLHKILFKYLLGLENSKFDEELFSILYDYMAGKFDFEDSLSLYSLI